MSWKDLITKGNLPQTVPASKYYDGPYDFVWLLLWLVVGKIKIDIRQSLPYVPFILASNHSCVWKDMILLPIINILCGEYRLSGPSGFIRVVSHDKVLRALGPITAWFLTKYMGFFPASIVSARKCLEFGDSIAICPEGMAYSDGGELHTFRTGTIVIANGEYIIVPICIKYGRYPGSWINKFPIEMQFIIGLFFMPWLKSGVTIVIGEDYIPSLNIQKETIKLHNIIRDMYNAI